MRNFDNRVICELIHIFLGQCPELMTELRRAVEESDAAKLERYAHKLKGSLGHFGTGPAYQAALQLEKAGRAKEMSHVADIHARLEKGIQRLIPALLKLCGDSDPAPERKTPA